MTAGIDWMPSWPATAGWSSMFILTRRTAPLAARTAFSITGLNILHGPHHGAQKSTSTGRRLRFFEDVLGEGQGCRVDDEIVTGGLGGGIG